MKKLCFLLSLLLTSPLAISNEYTYYLPGEELGFNENKIKVSISIPEKFHFGQKLFISLKDINKYKSYKCDKEVLEAGGVYFIGNGNAIQLRRSQKTWLDNLSADLENAKLRFVEDCE